MIISYFFILLVQLKEHQNTPSNICAHIHTWYKSDAHKFVDEKKLTFPNPQKARLIVFDYLFSKINLK
jgi:hypothetical protein